MHNRGSRVLPVVILLGLAASPVACGRGTTATNTASAAAPHSPSDPPRTDGTSTATRPGAPGTAGATTPSATPTATTQQSSEDDATALATQLTNLTKTLAPEDEVLSEREKRLTSVDAAFAYVRDTIGFESYNGILRGAEGMFHTRAGNALDRAMLLAAILESQKVPVRLVTGHLPPAVAERLFGRIFEQPALPKGAATSEPAEAIALKNRILARAHRDYNVIVKALGTVPTPPIQSHDDLLKEIEAHAWVQAQVNGRWIDLDPSFPDSRMDHAYTTVEQTYNGPPTALMQQVTIRVIAEMLQGNTLTHDVAVQTSMPAYRILDNQVYLAHAPPGLENVFSGEAALRPVLVINGDQVSGNAINFLAGSTPAGAQGGALNGVLGAFGAPQSSGPTFVAEWLEFEIDFPDGRKEISQRVLIDRAGTAWRRARTHDVSKLAPLARNAKGIVAAQTIYNMCFTAGGHDLLSFIHEVEFLVHGTVPSANPAHPTFQEDVWPLGMRDLSWVIASDGLIVPLLNDSAGLRFYADSPRIFVWSAGTDATGTPGVLVMQSDLRRDVLRGVAKNPSLAAAMGQHKVWFGALEGALEHELGVPALSYTGNSYVSTSSLADSGDVVVVTPQTVSQISARDQETDARMKAAVAMGDTLIVPKRVLTGGMSGWWQLSRAGDLRAVLDDDLDGSGFTKGGFTKGPHHIKTAGLGNNKLDPIPGKNGRTFGEFAEEAITLIIEAFAEASIAAIGAFVLEVIVIVVACIYAA